MGTTRYLGISILLLVLLAAHRASAQDGEMYFGRFGPPNLSRANLNGTSHTGIRFDDAVAHGVARKTVAAKTVPAEGQCRRKTGPDNDRASQ